MDRYAAWPERLYIIDEQGRISYKGGQRPLQIPPQGSPWTGSRIASREVENIPKPLRRTKRRSAPRAEAVDKSRLSQIAAET